MNMKNTHYIIKWLHVFHKKVCRKRIMSTCNNNKYFQSLSYKFHIHSNKHLLQHLFNFKILKYNLVGGCVLIENPGISPKVYHRTPWPAVPICKGV